MQPLSIYGLCGAVTTLAVADDRSFTLAHGKSRTLHTSAIIQAEKLHLHAALLIP